jgi:predicted dehydrogenase
MSKPSNRPSSASRRDFLKSSAVAAGTAVATQLSLPGVHAAGNDVIKVGVIGCGGRGTGAAEDVLRSAKGVTIHAVGDVFQFQVDHARERLNRLSQMAEIQGKGNTVDLNGRCFSGLDAYKQVIDSGVNYVILATSPGFRPIHLQAAVAAGKNIFTEKPVAVDSTGVRKVLDAYEEAKKKGLYIVAGTQRRHQLPYLETMKRIHDGAIGDIVGGQFYWMQGILWERLSKIAKQHPDLTSDVQKQIWNWYGYTWLCGDHIVEQHVHNLDVMNWATGEPPVAAVGMGFRTRTDPNYGSIFDFFSIDYEFKKGFHTQSMCRQISHCANEVGEHLVGTKGLCEAHSYSINGQRVTREKGTNPYVQEHTDLIECIRNGKPINELKQVAESTLTAIMGRMSAYTGKRVTWEQALNSKEDLMPKDLTLEMSLPVAPVAIPGKTPLV